jgi:hypothetical protein
VSADQASLRTTIRAWRDRLSPAGAGLPASRSRRAAGLRREELSELAGISVDYLVRLEQGRAASPSAQVLTALARALRLTRAKRDQPVPAGGPRLTGLIQRTLDGNPHFARPWHSGTVGVHAEDRKVIRHPDIGDITVDCDVLSGGDSDLKAVIYTAAPGSEDESKLALALVAGTRTAR